MRKKLSMQCNGKNFQFSCKKRNNSIEISKLFFKDFFTSLNQQGRQGKKISLSSPNKEKSKKIIVSLIKGIYQADFNSNKTLFIAYLR